MKKKKVGNIDRRKIRKGWKEELDKGKYKFKLGEGRKDDERYKLKYGWKGKKWVIK